MSQTETTTTTNGTSEADSPVLAALMREHVSVTVKMRGVEIEAKPIFASRVEAIARDLGPAPAKPADDAPGVDKRQHEEAMAARQRIMTYARVFDACSLPGVDGRLYAPGRRDPAWMRTKWVEWLLKRLSTTEIDALWEAVETAGVTVADEAARIGEGKEGGGTGAADG